MKLSRPILHRSAVITVGLTLMGSMASVFAQNPPPKAEIVDDAPSQIPSSPISPSDPKPPRPEIIPEDAPTQEAAPEAAPAAPRTKTPEEDLFDYCELLFSKGDYLLAIRQYGEYLKVFPTGKFREEARFKTAESRYRQKTWESALMEFDGYLRDFPRGRHRTMVLYKAGECHRNIAATLADPAARSARMAIAEDAYRATLQTTRTGQYAGYAAVRLAVLAYNAAATDPARYRDAIRWFGIAATEIPKEQSSIRYYAQFLKGKSLKYSGSLKEAAAAFEEVVRVKEGNEYYEKALTELATLDMEAGRQDSAMKRFELLARESAGAEIRADSMVSAGMIHADAGRLDEAIKYFEEASKAAGAPMAQARARYGLVFSHFKQKEYNKVIAAWRGIGDYSGLDNNNRARLLLIVGTSYAASNQHLRAAEIFGILEENMPGQPEAPEAGYKRLVSLFKLNDPIVPDAASGYVERWRERQPDSEYLDKAWLVRAAYYYNRDVWEQSAEAYQRVREDKMEPARLATYLYQRGSAEASAGDKQAVATLSRFLEKFPDDTRVPMALLHRGLAALKVEDYTGALADFDAILQKHPKSEGAESAAYHAGKVRGMKQDYAGMVAGFERLLKEFPQTKAAPEAWYWIGTGLFQQQKFKECLEPLRTAREKDLKSYYTDATLMIIGALTREQQVDPLMQEVDAYLRGTQEKPIPREILRWLGLTVFQSRQDYRAASRYLSQVVTYDDPRATLPEVWGTLGESQVENGSYESGIVALDHQLATEDRTMAKVRALLFKGRAHLALGKLDEATRSAEAGLDLDKETLTCAWLWILLGDIAMSSNRVNEAISSYGLVVLNWEDPTVTPLAMWKQISAYQKSGEPANATKADEVREKLLKRFPRFQPPKES